MANKVTTASAKCAIIWLVGEYAQLIKETAPDVLRVAAKGPRLHIFHFILSNFSEIWKNLNIFCQTICNFDSKAFIKEPLEVKLQILTLAAKLAVQEEVLEQVSLAATYVFNLARYDQSYDIRDRARFLKHLIFSRHLEISQYARDILLAPKPAPVAMEQSVRFGAGTLSDSLGIEAKECGTHFNEKTRGNCPI